MANVARTQERKERKQAATLRFWLPGASFELATLRLTALKANSSSCQSRAKSKGFSNFRINGISRIDLLFSVLVLDLARFITAC
jgi:hypothetical protein